MERGVMTPITPIVSVQLNNRRLSE